MRPQLIAALRGGAAQPIHYANEPFRFLVPRIEDRERAMVFRQRRKRHRIVEAPDGLLRRRGMRVNVIEIAWKVPTHEARAEEIARARHLAGRRREANLGPAIKRIASR